ncbi:hypothetical protein GCM10023092_16840 [Rurimicrobium arvi]|uniref:Secretion system C-terminal sorting domain-containing protein n=2 Tax=Rurimicrobium arvi TaxID=2049916 RepID=A0ABP8MQZ0_9BACT
MFLLLLLFFCSAAQAQSYFNRLYPNHSTGTIFCASSAQGRSGFMSVAMVVDSSSGKNGLRFFRFDAAGNEQASSFFEMPDTYPAGFFFYVFPGCMTRVDDNRYVILSEMESSVNDPIACLIAIDSDCHVTGFRELRNPYPGVTDSFMRSNSIGFDGTNLVTGHFAYYGSKTSRFMLMKHDTALHMLWAKTYAVGPNTNCNSGGLAVSEDGYALAGVSDNLLYDNDPRYAASAVVFKTDTSGSKLWEYICPETISTKPESIVRLDDGSYVFGTMGNVHFDRTGKFKSFVGQFKVFGVSSSGVQIWDTLYDSSIGSVGPCPIRFLEGTKTTFRTFIINFDVISADENKLLLFLETRNYSSLGNMLMCQKYYAPNAKDSIYYSLGGFNGPCRTQDGSALICGYFQDMLGKAMSPAQQGWIIKLDTNGCMGAGDPQCVPVSVPEQATDVPVISVYPNPVQSVLHIGIGNGIKGNFEILDIRGMRVQSRFLDGSSREYSLDMGTAAAGLYYYRFVSTDGTPVSGKFVYAP